MTTVKDPRNLERVRNRAREWNAILVLVILPFWLFRDHVIGNRTFLGNPDRLNSHLKVLKHHVDTLVTGDIAAWSGREMLGYDSFALPYTFPNPLTWLTYAFGAENLYVTAGFISIGLLACAGVAAYAALRNFVPDRIAALAGAIVFQFSSLSILKMSQNDMSFAVLIVIPLGVLSLRTIDPDRAVKAFLEIAAVLTVMLYFMFLQTAAYALMLLGAYALYRGWTLRSAVPLTAFASAFLVALTFAAPRIAGVAFAMSEYVRISPGRDLSSFDAIYKFQNILPHEILRWFDGSVFGRMPSDAAALGNNINLTEGFLLFSGSAATLIALAAVVKLDGRWLRLLRDRRDDGPFFVAVLVAGILVVVWQPALRIVYELFLRMDFTHARILIAALFSFSLIVALGLQSIRKSSRTGTAVRSLSAMVIGVLVAYLITIVSEQVPGYLTGWGMRIQYAALTNVALTAVLLFGLLVGVKRIPSSALAAWLVTALVAGLVIGQALMSADAQVNAASVRESSIPFYKGDFYAAPREHFRTPSDEAVAALQRSLETDRFRTALICDPASAGGLCAAHMANFWKLRLVDGYYGLGVPARIAALPWPSGLSLRAIYFTDPDALPWELLALLNVKYAMIVDGRWYANALADGRPTPRIFRNPYAPVPRAFFVEEIQRAESLREAIRRLSDDGVSVTRRSWVEGSESVPGMATGFVKQLTEGPDWVEVEFEPAPGARFLVLNELFNPNWRATVNGRPSRILPTNAFMRGVRVSAGATRVRFDYTPVTRQPIALLSYALGALLVAVGAMATKFVARRERPHA